MPDHNGRLTTKSQDVVFISPNHITRWLSDDSESTEAFLANCRSEGWPIFRHPDGTAYVFGLREVQA